MNTKPSPTPPPLGYIVSQKVDFMFVIKVRESVCHALQSCPVSICSCVCCCVTLQEYNQHVATVLCGAKALTHTTHPARCLNTCNTRAHMATNAATGWTAMIEQQLYMLLPLGKGTRGRKIVVIQKNSVNINLGKRRVSVNFYCFHHQLSHAA